VLRKPLLQALGKPELQSLGVKLGYKLDDVEDPNVRYGDDGRRYEAFSRPLRNDFVGFGTGYTESQLASRIRSTPLVKGITQLENVATRVRAIHT